LCPFEQRIFPAIALHYPLWIRKIELLDIGAPIARMFRTFYKMINYPLTSPGNSSDGQISIPIRNDAVSPTTENVTRPFDRDDAFKRAVGLLGDAVENHVLSTESKGKVVDDLLAEVTALIYQRLLSEFGKIESEEDLRRLQALIRQELKRTKILVVHPDEAPSMRGKLEAAM